MKRFYTRMLVFCLALEMTLGCLQYPVWAEETNSQAETGATVNEWIAIYWTNHIVPDIINEEEHHDHVTTKAELEAGALMVGSNKGGKEPLIADSYESLGDYSNDNELQPDKKITNKVSCTYEKAHDRANAQPDAVWWFDPSPRYPSYHIRTEVNGVTCYLTGNTRTGTVGLTTDENAATVWTVRITSSEDTVDNENGDNIGFVIYLGSENSPSQLNFHDSGSRGFYLDTEEEMKTNGSYVFEMHKPGTVEQRATYAVRLTERIIYKTTAADMTDIKETIYTDCSLEQTYHADYSDAVPLSWRASNVRLEDSVLQPGVPGTYEVPVLVQGVEIGTVTVVITPPTFTGILSPVSTVIDYGKSVAIPLFEGIDLQGYTAEALGLVEYDSAQGTEAEDGTYPDNLHGSYGSFSLSSDQIIYTPTHIVWDTERVLCVVRLRYGETAEYDRYLYQKVTVIPANIMYYETDIGGITLNGKWETKTIGSSDDAQSPGRPNDDTYGYDSSYDNDSQLSNGISLFAVGSYDADINDYPVSVEFDFVGTGIDIISRTGPEQGTVRITVTGSNGYEKTMSVCNKGTTELYQIPAFTLRALNGLDTYHVKIVVYPAVNYGEGFAHMNVGGEFYFDAIRIYNTTNSTEANDAYAQAGQANSLISRIRDILIAADTFVAEGAGEITGAIFIDYAPDSNLEQKFDVASYQKYGPNNELYLGSNQAIAFKLGWGEMPASLDIAAKAVEDKETHLSVTLKSTEGVTLAALEKDIVSCTAQYFDLLDPVTEKLGNEVYVVICNNGSGILSVTDLKTAYASAAEQPRDVTIQADLQTLAAARDTMQCQMYSAEFASSTVRLASLCSMTVYTNQNVEALVIRDTNGTAVWHTDIYTETGTGRVWTVLMRPTLLGDIVYTVTGYSEDPACKPGSITAGITVTF